MIIILAILYQLTFKQIEMVKDTPIEFKVFYEERPTYSGLYDGEKIEIFVGGYSKERGIEVWIPYVIKNTIPHEMGHIIYQKIRTYETDKELVDNFKNQEDYKKLSEKFEKYESIDLPAEIYANKFNLK